MEQGKESLVLRLRKRAEIRRSIPRGEKDRISDILEEAAMYIISLENQIEIMKAQKDYSESSGNYASL